ncbi:MAG: polysaccharide deacetylase family protein [Calditrichaeota bacterium]|nr:polysaccharide deacetylase family protein [Calditrichota bacterium]
MRSKIKSFYFQFLDKSRFNKFVRLLKKPSVTILTYHSVVPDDSPVKSFEYRNCVAESAFNRQLDFLKKNFKVISLEEAVEKIENNNLEGHYIVITFDDGYHNNYAYALPVLKKHRLTACFFVTTGLIDSNDCLWTDWITYLLMKSAKKRVKVTFEGEELEFDLGSVGERIQASMTLRRRLKESSFFTAENVLSQLKEQINNLPPPVEAEPDRYAFMTWQEVISLAENGMAVGSHTHRHTLLSMIRDQEVRYELKHSKEEIESHTCKECSFFAYPNGQLSDFKTSHFRILSDLKYKAAVTQVSGTNYNDANLFLLKRINISNLMTLAVFKAYVSGSFKKRK